MGTVQGNIMTGQFYMDGVDISTLGTVAVLGSEAYPLTGLFDLPRRKGETERNWGTEIEAFVDGQDIELDGRTLTLTMLVRGSGHAEYVARLNELKAACLACKVLRCPVASFSVIQRDDISVSEYTGNHMALVTARFYEEAVNIPVLAVTPSGGDGFLLDGFNLMRDLSVGVSEVTGLRNPGKRIEVDTTATYKRTTYRDKAMVTLKCWMTGRDMADLYGKTGQLSALCARPGLRTLTTPDKTVRDLYIKDGFTVGIEHATALTFDLKLRMV